MSKCSLVFEHVLTYQNKNKSFNNDGGDFSERVHFWGTKEDGGEIVSDPEIEFNFYVSLANIFNKCDKKAVLMNNNGIWVYEI